MDQKRYGLRTGRAEKKTNATPIDATSSLSPSLPTEKSNSMSTSEDPQDSSVTSTNLDDLNEISFDETLTAPQRGTSLSTRSKRPFASKETFCGEPFAESLNSSECTSNPSNNSSFRKVFARTGLNDATMPDLSLAESENTEFSTESFQDSLGKRLFTRSRQNQSMSDFSLSESKTDINSFELSHSLPSPRNVFSKKSAKPMKNLTLEFSDVNDDVSSVSSQESLAITKGFKRPFPKPLVDLSFATSCLEDSAMSTASSPGNIGGKLFKKDGERVVAELSFEDSRITDGDRTSVSDYESNSTRKGRTNSSSVNLSAASSPGSIDRKVFKKDGEKIVADLSFENSMITDGDRTSVSDYESKGRRSSRRSSSKTDTILEESLQENIEETQPQEMSFENSAMNFETNSPNASLDDSTTSRTSKTKKSNMSSMDNSLQATTSKMDEDVSKVLDIVDNEAALSSSRKSSLRLRPSGICDRSDLQVAIDCPRSIEEEMLVDASFDNQGEENVPPFQDISERKCGLFTSKKKSLAATLSFESSQIPADETAKCTPLRSINKSPLTKQLIFPPKNKTIGDLTYEESMEDEFVSRTKNETSDFTRYTSPAPSSNQCEDSSTQQNESIEKEASSTLHVVPSQSPSSLLISRNVFLKKSARLMKNLSLEYSDVNDDVSNVSSQSLAVTKGFKRPFNKPLVDLSFATSTLEDSAMSAASTPGNIGRKLFKKGGRRVNAELSFEESRITDGDRTSVCDDVSDTSGNDTKNTSSANASKTSRSSGSSRRSNSKTDTSLEESLQENIEETQPQEMSFENSAMNFETNSPDASLDDSMASRTSKTKKSNLSSLNNSLRASTSKMDEGRVSRVLDIVDNEAALSSPRKSSLRLRPSGICDRSDLQVAIDCPRSIEEKMLVDTSFYNQGEENVPPLSPFQDISEAKRDLFTSKKKKSLAATLSFESSQTIAGETSKCTPLRSINKPPLTRKLLFPPKNKTIGDLTYEESMEDENASRSENVTSDTTRHNSTSTSANESEDSSTQLNESIEKEASSSLDDVPSDVNLTVAHDKSSNRYDGGPVYAENPDMVNPRNVFHPFLKFINSLPEPLVDPNADMKRMVFLAWKEELEANTKSRWETREAKQEKLLAAIKTQKPKPSIRSKEVKTKVAPRPPVRVLRPGPWASRRLYSYLTSRLQPEFGIRSFLKAEEVIGLIDKTMRTVAKSKNYEKNAVEELMKQLAKLNIVGTTLDFYKFVRDFLPQEFETKVVPAIQPFTNAVFPPKVGHLTDSDPILL